MQKLALALLVSLLVPAALFAQSPPATQLWYVHEEVARPSMLAQYEATTKEFGAMVRANNQPFYYSAFATDDFRYYFVNPIKNFAEIDSMMAAFPAMAAKDPQKFADLMRRAGAVMDHTNEWVVRQRNDLSYMPATPRVEYLKAPASHFEFYHLQPGAELDVEGIAKAWQAAMKARELTNGFVVFEAVMGPELPAVIVQTWGNSAADIAAATMQDMQKLGGETTMKLTTQTLAGVRRYESRYAQFRPDLSNLPPPPAAAKK